MVMRIERHGARALSLVIDVLHQVDDAQIAVVRALGEQPRQLLRVTCLAHLIVEHEQIRLARADQVVQALPLPMHNLNVRVGRTQRLIVILPLAVHPNQARGERLNQSVLEHLSQKARLITAN